MPDIKFSQLPDLPNPTPATIIPVVDSGVNYTVTANTLQGFVNSTTGNVTAGNLVTSGRITATGNITGNYFIGNGSLLTGITSSSYGNANVAAYLPTYTGNITANTISASGNVTGAFIKGDGSQLTNLPAGNYSNANVAAYLPTYSGNITAGNIAVTGRITTATATATGNISGGNILTAGIVSATGNITGNFFIGNGSQLTGINANYSNANVASYLPTYTGAMTAMTGNVTTTANVQGAFVKGNGTALTGVVTSITAGNGISINQSTGAVTITATGNGGGGGGDTIISSNGLNFANVGAANNRVIIQVGNSTPTITPGTAADVLQIINQTGNSYIALTPTGSAVLKLAPTGQQFQLTTGCISQPGMTFLGNGTLQCQVVQSPAGVSTAKITTNANYAPYVFNAGFQGPQLTKTGTSSGTAGEICWDTNYIYVCTAANTWKRVALTAF